MTKNLLQLENFKKDLGDISFQDGAKVLETKSKDYYWYSPILKKKLNDRLGQLFVAPTSEDELVKVIAAATRNRIPITMRGGGTGNYGQCIPLQGGVIIEMTKLSKILRISEGKVLCQSGARIEKVEDEVSKTGQMLCMFPSTKRLATMGGFIAGGSGGIGSIKNGMLRDPNNISYAKVISAEESPKIIELFGADTLDIQHAYGTNGVILEMEYALKPSKEWVHSIALFDEYRNALNFAISCQKKEIDNYLMTIVEKRFARFYKKISNYFPQNKDAVFSMIAPECFEQYENEVSKHNGEVSLTKNLKELSEEKLPPTWECGWNHTTLQALKMEPDIWTYLQIAYPHPFDPDLVIEQQKRYGDELYFHHEMARLDGHLQIFAIPILRWTSEARIYEIIKELENEDKCLVFDPHAYTIEDGGMKEIDSKQIKFKKRVDPHGLMNPGKTRGWTDQMVVK